MSWDGWWPLSAPAAAKIKKKLGSTIYSASSRRVESFVGGWDAGWRCDFPTLAGAMGAAAYPHS